MPLLNRTSPPPDPVNTWPAPRPAPRPAGCLAALSGVQAFLRLATGVFLLGMALISASVLLYLVARLAWKLKLWIDGIP